MTATALRARSSAAAMRCMQASSHPAHPPTHTHAQHAPAGARPAAPRARSARRCAAAGHRQSTPAGATCPRPSPCPPPPPRRAASCHNPSRSACQGVGCVCVRGGCWRVKEEWAPVQPSAEPKKACSIGGGGKGAARTRARARAHTHKPARRAPPHARTSIACPNVWPRLSVARTPPSRSSAATTSALFTHERSIA